MCPGWGLSGALGGSAPNSPPVAAFPLCSGGGSFPGVLLRWLFFPCAPAVALFPLCSGGGSFSLVLRLWLFSHVLLRCSAQQNGIQIKCRKIRLSYAVLRKIEHKLNVEKFDPRMQCSAKLNTNYMSKNSAFVWCARGFGGGPCLVVPLRQT